MTESIPEPNWPTEKIIWLVKLRNQAMSSGEIAAAMKITRNAVIGKLSRMKLKSLNYRIGWQARAAKPEPVRGTPSIAAIMATAGRKPYRSAKKPAKTSTQPPKLKTRPRTKPRSGKPIYMLMDRECRWPVGNDKTGVHLFCAAQTDNGPYCAAHHGKGVQE